MSMRHRCFYPRHPCGWRRFRRCGGLGGFKGFLSTPPVWVATGVLAPAIHGNGVSIHATRVGGDALEIVTPSFVSWFLSTPPVWVATVERDFHKRRVLFLSTPPVWVATPLLSALKLALMFLSTPPVWVATGGTQEARAMYEVSIHATRVGGDKVPTLRRRLRKSFYPRHPCGWRRATLRCPRSSRRFYPRHPCGWRHRLKSGLWDDKKFLSTPPVWVATASRHWLTNLTSAFLSTPPVWVATSNLAVSTPIYKVSIHATRVGGDSVPLLAPAWFAGFLSTPPVWVATDLDEHIAHVGRVSIHATRVGGDHGPWRRRDGHPVSIHATRVGGDTPAVKNTQLFAWFLSTPPVWVATDEAVREAIWLLVSIHATRVGGDGWSAKQMDNYLVSIHATRVGGDGHGVVVACLSLVSIHATRVGGDWTGAGRSTWAAVFLSTPPVWVATRA